MQYMYPRSLRVTLYAEMLLGGGMWTIQDAELCLLRLGMFSKPSIGYRPYIFQK